MSHRNLLKPHRLITKPVFAALAIGEPYFPTRDELNEMVHIQYVRNVGYRYKGSETLKDLREKLRRSLAATNTTCKKKEAQFDFLERPHLKLLWANVRDQICKDLFIKLKAINPRAIKDKQVALVNKFYENDQFMTLEQIQ
mmetsp:Transcript_2805/g.4390  ORF Transcript_2805/g.4390 Transcript_2805/m.4390 type:complete len:141 (+) Transcript_2805:576-998(+)|eukprot:CAMPEP_0170484252 /NCGR_PEP_ID=MMETSP0208-20121228/3752_1 /TAXON_ID=197538 /ORGANISM="Strombidium inclinatum, Strain S3" /LENGTH=140 /DNA_ID=CAMNT_0010757537 /DNA_START=571 /DNA_END=993 /DNA_ORIENTATION=-